MPRAGWTKPETDQRLSDHLAIAMLTRAYPPSLVDRVIASTDRAEERRRLLPARVVVYYVIAMALFQEASYEEAMRRLLEGLAWQDRWSTGWQVPTKAAIFKARSRLGVDPVAELFHQAVRPLATPGIPGAWYRGRPVITVDRLELELSKEGSAGHKDDGPAASTLVVTGLVEGGTNVVLDLTTVGLLEVGGELPTGALCLTDHRASTASSRADLRRRGRELVWATDEPPTEIVEDLIDGSQLALVRTDPAVPPDRLRYLQGVGADEPLLTTLLDPAAAPADELRHLYAHRATVTSCLEDLRVHQRAPGLVPRSKSTDGALQEIYGLLLAHYAIQSLLVEHPAAAENLMVSAP